MKPRKPLLLDCDGVFADFCGHTIAVAKEKNPSLEFTVDQIETDTRQYPYWEQAGLEQIVKGPGFCENIPVIPGSKEFLERIRKADIQIMFVTSPMKDSKYWHHERAEWLKKHFNVSRTELIFATEKRYVNGLMLLDDHVGNVLHWQEYNGTPAILIEQPWNKDLLKDVSSEVGNSFGMPWYWHTKKHMGVTRGKDWNKIYDMVMYHHTRYY